MPRKIGAGSIWTLIDQENWYRETMGDEAANRQSELAKKEQGKCICKTSTKERTLKRKWDGERITARATHEPGCPKRKKWMDLI